MLGPNSAVLSSIGLPHVDLVVWQRRVPLCLARKLRTADISDWPDTRFQVRRDSIGADLAEVLAGVDPLFVADVRDLAAKYVAIRGCEQMSVRIERVTDNACRKFHADYVGVRLITTYLGPGTEWLEQDELQIGASSRHLVAGDVGLFKGRTWSVNYAPRIVHRSPPIAGRGITRLLLVIDDLIAADA